MADKLDNVGISEASLPPEVFHFTSMDAMMNIVKRRSIWCTAIPYLNDATERTFLTDAVQRRLPSLLREDQTLDQSLSLRTKEVQDLHLLSQLANEPFVASFSKTGDSLMHWRSYCPQHSGIALGFRTQCLEEAQIDEAPAAGMVLPAINFGQVGYVDVRNQSAVDSIIYRAIRNAAKALKRAGRGPSGDNINAYFQWAVDALACTNKHESFQVEGEYRLLLSDVRFRENNICFRSVRSTLVPYVQLRIPSVQGDTFSFKENIPWNAICSVVIGPTANMNLTEKSVRAFFELQRIDVEVRPSQIPYRDW